jgi:uncharacterized membrane protein
MGRWYNPVSLGLAFIRRPKIVAAAVVGFATYAALGSVSVSTAARPLLAWMAASLVYIAAAVVVMTRDGIAGIQRRAADHDESAIIIPVVVMAAIAASFLAVVGVLSEAKAASGSAKVENLMIAGVTILLSWSVMQIVYTFHYAHEFYAALRSQPGEAPLGFSGKDQPDYWDFLYFAATVGATSQTSDTEVCSPRMRRLVTVHGVISFFFNTIVLALTINIAAGLI